ncbi:MAG: peptide chain release factor N(5)-glutamine methyltransferase [Candidatus Kaiserbacteria bacterium]|nr:peptide chain release factor N(5)-glutamine methyltransferase [Candidatus Kaiserbacteria bacterium]
MTKDEQWLLKEKYNGKETPEYEADKKRLAKGEPLGYVIGWQPFLGLKIYLDSKPLIPRPETEWWTEQLLNHVGFRKPHMTFLDICAGSGAIGCAALKALPYMEVFFGEIDPAHEKTILKNIHENNLNASRAHIGIGDLFEPFGNLQFDVIAVNPPYIPDNRILQSSVADYEPSRALRAGVDGLDLIRRIALSTRCHLTEGGETWIECDSEHSTIALSLFESQGLRAKILNDQYDKPRVICAKMI